MSKLIDNDVPYKLETEGVAGRGKHHASYLCTRCGGGALEPAGYPTFALRCPKCALLHNRDGTELRIQHTPQPKMSTKGIAQSRKEIEDLYKI